jgi:hypothetical protein
MTPDPKGIGFTGSQRGMTPEQTVALFNLLLFEPESEFGFHHGDCIGADAGAHEIALILFRPIVVHPPDRDVKRAFCPNATEVRDPAPYMVRNQAIVNETLLLVACPDGPEHLRSGTWSTVRYARKIGRPVVLITPDGSVLANREGGS